ncbi:hypothetical protein HPULCUR_008150 [Helicostylum pulchrum]|uniref:Homeobox domain-containing protein n=1 Tax=Helicostylum pulchrum TaxID=562976 RepID=A0ABP9Y6U7_9FUNG
MSKERSRRASFSSEEIYTAEDDNLSSGDEMYYGTPVRPRQRFSTEETSILERAFKETPRPSAEIKKDLAYQFGTVPSRIQIWFQNRRAKEKKISGISTPQTAENRQYKEDRRETPQAKKPRTEDGIEPIVPLRPNVYYSDSPILSGPDMFLYPHSFIFTNPRNIDPGVGSSRGSLERFRHSPTIDNNILNHDEEDKDVHEDNIKKGSFWMKLNIY